MSDDEFPSVEDLKREMQARAEERRREIALECASRVWVERTAPYRVGSSVIETAHDFENYLRGDA